MELQPVPHCPVCGADDRVALHRGLRDPQLPERTERFDIVRCTSCGTAHLDPRPTDATLGEAYASSYYTHTPPAIEDPSPAGAAARFRRALRNGHINSRYGYSLSPATRAAPVLLALTPSLREIAERLIRHLAPGGRLLDVGCANGTFVAYAGQVGWQATGIDVDAASVAIGRQHGLDLHEQTLADHAANHPGTYDAITMSHVIEHIADPVEFLAAARRALAPGGTLWVATPNLRALGHRRYGTHWIGLDPPRHLVLFDPTSLRRALAAAGFTTVEDASFTPAATHHLAHSAAIARGEPLRLDPPPPAPLALRLRGAIADRVARRRPGLAEELVVLARI